MNNDNDIRIIQDNNDRATQKSKLNNRSYVKIATWNIRSINGKENEIIEEMKLQKLDYLGVTEIKKKGRGMEELKDGYWLYWSGVETKERGAEGVGLVVKPENINNILKERYVNSRLMTLDVKCKNR